MIIVMMMMMTTCGQRAAGVQLRPCGQSGNCTAGCWDFAEEDIKGHERPGRDRDDVEVGDDYEEEAHYEDDRNKGMKMVILIVWCFEMVVRQLTRQENSSQNRLWDKQTRDFTNMSWAKMPTIIHYQLFKKVNKLSSKMRKRCNRLQ